MKPFKNLMPLLLYLFLINCSHTPDNSNLVAIEKILDKPQVLVNKTILIQGVVNQVNPDKLLFSVISQKEFEECGISECNASEQLPIRYQGDLPAVGQQIEIVGIVKGIDQGFIYEAESIRNIENL
jgi:hypothetical protein